MGIPGNFKGVAALILLICRVVSALFLIGAGTYFFLNIDYFEDLEPQLSGEMARLNELREDHAQEINATQQEISQKLMERSKFRREYEELEEKITELKEEQSFLVPKYKQVEEKFKQVEKEAGDVEKEIALLQEEVEKESSKQEPYSLRIADLENQLEQSRAQVSSVKEELEIMEGNFSKISNVRKIAQKSFLSSKELLLAEIVKPNHLFYDDKIEITVENIAPSNTGFFIKKGRESGFREDQLFVASEQEDFDDQIFRLRCKFAEDKLSYFEFDETTDILSGLQLFEGLNLSLIRTGDFLIERDSAQLVKD